MVAVHAVVQVWAPAVVEETPKAKRQEHVPLLGVEQVVLEHRVPAQSHKASHTDPRCPHMARDTDSIGMHDLGGGRDARLACSLYSCCGIRMQCATSTRVPLAILHVALTPAGEEADVSCCPHIIL